MATNYYSVYLGGNDAFSITDHADLRPTGNYTIGAWIKTTATNNPVVYFEGGSQTTNWNGLMLQVIGNPTANIVLSHSFNINRTTGYAEVYGTSQVNDGAWHWVVGTYDGAHLKVYVDGDYEAEANCTTNAGYASPSFPGLGCAVNTGTPDNFFVGNLDEFFLINGTAWTSTNVTSYYQKFIIGATNLKAYYQFENGNTDSSGNTHTLTNIDVPVFQINSPFAGDVSTNYLKNYRANTGGRLSFQ